MMPWLLSLLLQTVTAQVPDLRAYDLASTYTRPAVTAEGQVVFLSQRLDASWILTNPARTLENGTPCQEYVPHPFMSRIQSLLYVQVPIEVRGVTHLVTYGVDIVTGEYPYDVRPIRLRWCA